MLSERYLYIKYRQHLGQWFSEYGFPRTSIFWELIISVNFWPHPRPVDPETRRMDPSNVSFDEPCMILNLTKVQES